MGRAASSTGTRYFFRTAQSLPKVYPPPFNYFENFCAEHAEGWVAGGNLVHEALQQRKRLPFLLRGRSHSASMRISSAPILKPETP